MMEKREHENDKEVKKAETRHISNISFVLSGIILTSNLAAYIFSIEIKEITLYMTYALAIILFVNGILFRRNSKIWLMEYRY